MVRYQINIGPVSRMPSHLQKPESPTGNFKFGDKQDVAAMLGLCRRSVDNLLERGLPHLKLGRRRIRFDLEEVRLWAKREFGTARTGKVGVQ
ncbi:MAG: DNA-binding protein [Proteobacteria bacterium]|nr:DNA-binding protein [Verrucomicrobiota bacterium]NBU10908.1 DNA-binding protein [Pseudomonadota bacterium]